MPELALRIAVFLVGVVVVAGTLLSAISTFVLPRAARSQLNRLVFGLLRRLFEFFLRFAPEFRARDTIMGYYAPIGLILLLPTWYLLVALGYSAMFWALGSGSWVDAIRLSGSSLFTLGFVGSENPFVNLFIFSEAALGLILVALLIAYLPTMYAAFSRREEAVNLLEVRAGNPPSAIEMLLRYNRIHGLDRLNEYWRTWEVWFADIEESHTVLPALVFFRSPRAENSWVTAAGTVLDAAALTLSAVRTDPDPAAALCLRAGYLALRRVVDYFEIPYPADPHFPEIPISITPEEFHSALEKLAASGVPLKADRQQSWKDFAGWRVNYDHVLLALCSLTMAPKAAWSSDRSGRPSMSPIFHRKMKS